MILSFIFLGIKDQTKLIRGRVFHFPFVKSGKSIACDLFATEAHDNGTIALLVTES
jgi:hypothetical protein